MLLHLGLILAMLLILPLLSKESVALACSGYVAPVPHDSMTQSLLWLETASPARQIRHRTRSAMAPTKFGRPFGRSHLCTCLIGHARAYRQVKAPHKASLFAGFYGQDGEHLICCTACHEVVTRSQDKQLVKIRRGSFLGPGTMRSSPQIAIGVGCEWVCSWRHEGKFVFRMPRET